MPFVLWPHPSDNNAVAIEKCAELSVIGKQFGSEQEGGRGATGTVRTIETR